MVEGELDICWINRQDQTATPRYRINFLAYSGFQNGAQPNREIVGEEMLFNYLVDLQAVALPIEWRSQRAREWLLEAHRDGFLSLQHTQLSDQQCDVFRRAS